MTDPTYAELKRDNEKLKAALAVYEFTLQFVLKLKGTPLEDLMATQIVAARMAYKEAVPDGDTYRMFLEEPA